MARGLARHGGRSARGRRAIVLVAAICAASSPATALAVGLARTPSAEHLRNTYPLETNPPRSRPATALPARPASSRKPVQAAKEDGNSLTSRRFLVVLLALLAALVLVVPRVWRALRRRPPELADGASGTASPRAGHERMPSLAILGSGAADNVAASPSASPSPSPPPSASPGRRQSENDRVDQGSDRPRPRPSRRFEPRRGALTGTQPDAARQWTAEIAWRKVHGRSRFVVCARPGDGPQVVILTSDAVKWPPRGREDVAALERVVRGLEGQLLRTGWTALESGQAWYAKRFAWAPRDAAPDPAMASSPPAAEQAQPAPSSDAPELSSG
jgi:hypothetical protein